MIERPLFIIDYVHCTHFLISNATVVHRYLTFDERPEDILVILGRISNILQYATSVEGPDIDKY